jgi:hypothetical protein
VAKYALKPDESASRKLSQLPGNTYSIYSARIGGISRTVALRRSSDEDASYECIITDISAI